MNNRVRITGEVRVSKMAILNWRHHALIQALMTRGPLKEQDFRNMFSIIASKTPNSFQKEFNDYLLIINKELSYVQMELRACSNQNDGEVYYGLVNNVADEQSKLGTKYSVPQIILFKGIMEAVLNNIKAQGSISIFDALNLRLESQVQTASQSQEDLSQVPAALRNFSMSHKQKTIDELVKDKWLYDTSEGYIGLGVRSYLELRSLFHNSGIPSCEVCNEAGVKAKVCPNEECTVRMHDYCLKKKLSKCRGGISCPNCSIQWQHLIPKAKAREDNNEPEGSDSQAPAGSRRRNHGAETDPTEQQNMPDDTEVLPPLESRRKRLRTNNRNGTVVTSQFESSQVSYSSDSRRVTRSSARR